MKLRVLSATAVFALLVVAASVAVAQMPFPFSADMKMTGGKMGEVTGKMYFAGSKLRMDNNVGGHESSMISDLPSKTVYTIMPQQRMYMEFHGDQMPGARQRPSWKPYGASNPCENEPGVTCKKVGTETVNGRTCDKWEFTGAKGGNSTVWIDQKSHIPIKTTMQEMTWELSNIKEGPQPASLFEVPAGYQKMDMGGMMRGMQPPQ